MCVTLRMSATMAKLNGLPDLSQNRRRQPAVNRPDTRDLVRQLKDELITGGLAGLFNASVRDCPALGYEADFPVERPDIDTSLSVIWILCRSLRGTSSRLQRGKRLAGLRRIAREQ
jgi:hypothetical protein